MSKKQSLTRRSLHYYWLATRNHLGLFVALVASTIGFCGFLTYGNPYVMSLIVDRIAAEPVAADQVFAVFGPYIAALIGINVAGQACSKLQDYTLWKLQIAVNYDLATMARNCLVNLCRIAGLRPYVGGRLLARLDNDEEIVISRKYAGEIRKRLDA